MTSSPVRDDTAEKQIIKIKTQGKEKLVTTYSCGALNVLKYTNGVIAPLHSLRSSPRVKTRGYRHEIPPGLDIRANLVKYRYHF